MIVIVGGNRSSCSRGHRVLMAPSVEHLGLPENAVVVDCMNDEALNQLAGEGFFRADNNYILEHAGHGLGFRSSSSARQAQICNSLAQHRAIGCDVVILSRSYKDLDKRIQRLADVMFNFA